MMRSSLKKKENYSYCHKTEILEMYIKMVISNFEGNPRLSQVDTDECCKDDESGSVVPSNQKFRNNLENIDRIK